MSTPQYDDDADNVTSIDKGRRSKRYELDDSGLIDYFNEKHGHEFRYCEALGWLYYRPKLGTWQVEALAEVTDTMLALVRALRSDPAWLASTGKATRADQRKALHGFAARCASVKLRSIVDMATLRPSLRIDAEKLDSDGLVLAFTNCVVDLRTGAMLEQRPDRYLTKGLDFDYNPAAPTPRAFVEKLINWQACDDEDEATYILQVYGSGLRGDVTGPQEYYIFRGDGSNGKGVTQYALEKHLGPYLEAPSSALIASGISRNAEGPTPAVLSLRGARAILMSELPSGALLDAALVKRWSAHDTETARGLYGKKAAKFPIVGTMILYTNDMPRMSAPDFALKRRTRVIKLTQTAVSKTFTGGDSSIYEELDGERDGIVTLLVKFAVMQNIFKQIVVTPGVESATREMFDEQDDLERFLREETVTGAGYRIATRQLYEEYKRFYPETKLGEWQLGQRLKKIEGIDTTKRGLKKATITGLTLRPDHPYWTDQFHPKLKGSGPMDNGCPPFDATYIERRTEQEKAYTEAKPLLVRALRELKREVMDAGAQWPDVIANYTVPEYVLNAERTGNWLDPDVGKAPYAGNPADTTNAPENPQNSAPTSENTRSAECGNSRHSQCQNLREELDAAASDADAVADALACMCSCHERRQADDEPTPGPEPTTFAAAAQGAVPLPTSALESRPQESADYPHGFSSRVRRPYTADAVAYVNAYEGHGIAVPADDMTGSGKTFALDTKQETEETPLAAFLTELDGNRYAGSVKNVYLTGRLPGGGTSLGMFKWGRKEIPEGWAYDGRGQFLDKDNRNRVSLHYVKPNGERLSIHSPSIWLGNDTDITPTEYARGMAFFRRAGADAFGSAAILGRGEGRIPLPIKGTPAATALDLITRTLPRDGRDKDAKPVRFPMLSPDDQELIRSTGTQGRIQFRGALTEFGDSIPGLYMFDRRWAYASTSSLDLPVGPVTYDDEPTFEPGAPIRYRIRVTVPANWTKVGIFGKRSDGQGRQPWEYPEAGADTFETWAWGKEIELALKWRDEDRRPYWVLGQHIEIVRRMVFTGWARPLRTFTEAMVKLRETWLPAHRHEVDELTFELARDFARAVHLHGIGALQGRATAKGKVVPTVDLPLGVDDSLTIEEGASLYHEADGQRGTLVHPEWCSYVWMENRVRLLDMGKAQPGAGALYLDASEVLDMHTDSITATVPLDWADTGSVGQFRAELVWGGELPTPRKRDELLDLRATIEADLDAADADEAAQMETVN